MYSDAGERMLMRVARDSSVPVSQQILEQVPAQILAGNCLGGTQLPSVRRLAGRLAVHPNTLVRVYQRLSAAGGRAAAGRRHACLGFIGAEPWGSAPDEACRTDLPIGQAGLPVGLHPSRAAPGHG